MFLVLVAAAPISAQPSPEHRGDSLIAAFDNAGALEAYRQALADRESFDLLFKAASAAMLVGQYLAESPEEYFEEAVAYAERLHDRYPNEPGSWTLLAGTTGQLARFRGAREKARVARGIKTRVTQALALDSTYVYAYVVAGILAREMAKLGWLKRLAANAVLGGLPTGSLGESRDYLDRAIRYGPGFIIAHWEFATTCLAMDREAEALAHIKYIARLTPANSEEDRLKRKAAMVGAELSRRLQKKAGG